MRYPVVLRLKNRGHEPSVDYSQLTKAEIIKILDKREIEYNKRQTKDELIALLGGE